jgi:hypothetical protein
MTKLRAVMYGASRRTARRGRAHVPRAAPEPRAVHRAARCAPSRTLCTEPRANSRALSTGLRRRPRNRALRADKCRGRAQFRVHVRARPTSARGAARGVWRAGGAGRPSAVADLERGANAARGRGLQWYGRSPECARCGTNSARCRVGMRVRARDFKRALGRERWGRAACGPSAVRRCGLRPSAVRATNFGATAHPRGTMGDGGNQCVNFF